MEILVFIFLIIIFISIASGKGRNKKRRYKPYNKKDSFIFRDKKRNMPYNQSIYQPKKYEAKEYFFKDRFEDLGKNNQSYNQESSYTEENKNISKKEKGDNYETYVANYFRENGYYVWEHGKEKGIKDSSIDLIIKKEEYIYFVQCKDWTDWKINHKEVKATRTDVREYLKNNKNFFNLIKNYKQKILYVTSKECLTKGAYTYIEENKDILEYQVIPIKA